MRPWRPARLLPRVVARGRSRAGSAGARCHRGAERALDLAVSAAMTWDPKVPEGLSP